jgi:hypothetical protein
MPTWFEQLTGFTEKNTSSVQQNIRVTGNKMISLVNGRTMTCGTLHMPSLAELRQQVNAAQPTQGKTIVREVIANVQQLHKNADNHQALFQVASQFNLLEMVSPNTTPEQGVALYEYDYTQGPACAIAAGAGTIYRNYFVPLNNTIGQSSTQQIDLLADLGNALGNTNNRLWTMQNGYALASANGLRELTTHLNALHENERDQLRQLLRIGLHANTEVTLMEHTHQPQLVTQAYCSALPVAYSGHAAEDWQAFATLVLEAAYEATLCASILNAWQHGNNKVFLTLLGGGAFGNQTAWIVDAIERALQRYKQANLEVYIVSHSASNPSLQHLFKKY